MTEPQPTGPDPSGGIDSALDVIYDTDTQEIQDPSVTIALADLRGILVGIMKIDPSNTGTGRDDTYRYATRNALVMDAVAAAMRANLPTGVRWSRNPMDDYGWPVIFIDLPTGEQLSWHMPPYQRAYDGHTTSEKYARIRAWSRSFTGAPDGHHAD